MTAQVRIAGPGDADALLRLKQGLGTALLAEAKRWAAAHGLHRLELTVMAHNHRAAGLYERMGFSVEGRRRECLLIDGEFVDELYMAATL